MKWLYFVETMFLFVVAAMAGKEITWFSGGTVIALTGVGVLSYIQKRTPAGDLRTVRIAQVAAFTIAALSLLALLFPELRPQPALPVEIYLWGVMVIQVIVVFVAQRIIKKAST